MDKYVDVQRYKDFIIDNVERTRSNDNKITKQNNKLDLGKFF